MKLKTLNTPFLLGIIVCVPAESLSFNSQEKLFTPAGQCLISAGRFLSGLESTLSAAIENQTPMTHNFGSLRGGLASADLVLDGSNLWRLDITLPSTSCGILAGSVGTCRLINSCGTYMGPYGPENASDACSPVDNVYQLSCHITIKAGNRDLFSAAGHNFVCERMSNYLVQDKALFDLVSTTGDECDAV